MVVGENSDPIGEKLPFMLRDRLRPVKVLLLVLTPALA